ncbi:Hsp70 family protein [Peribacillus kribbensis]|uniref:Hsp70 family protein n=1 Tax=Peribacillus kribbensis TaxID=356658 RepID=UPI00041098BC|nr:Hsp70 family protein [Peribacillus kribbensis]
MAYFVGIDLGTTNSTVSVIEYNDFLDNPIEKLKTLSIYQYDKNHSPNLNAVELPSVLYFDLDNETVYTGEYAKSIYGGGSRPMQTVRGVKTRIGGESAVEIPSISGKKSSEYFDMKQCSALYLKTIRLSLEKQLNEEIDEVTITIPAAFNNDERIATENAARLAGFKNVNLLDEPTAALYWHIHDPEAFVEEQLSEEGMNVLVYDIGGGTLDVSIANISQDLTGDVDINIIARSPRMDLGGNNFDQLLGAYFLSEFERARSSITDRAIEEQNRIIARIVSEAEKAKIEFNDRISQYIDKPRRRDRQEQAVGFEVIDGQSTLTTITYPMLNQIFSCYTDREGRETLLAPIKQTLSEANIKPEDISEILFTGGMSNFYLVEETIRQYFTDIDMIQYKFIDPVSAVSKGASIYQFAQEEDHVEIKKLKLQDRMADDILIKIGSSYDVMIPRTVNPGEQGVFEYQVPEEEMIDIPIFLYYGLGNDPSAYTPIDGRFFKLQKAVDKDDVIRIEWFFDRNKTVHLKILEHGELTIEEKTVLLSPSEALKDPIHRLKVNGSIFGS